LELQTLNYQLETLSCVSFTTHSAVRSLYAEACTRTHHAGLFRLFNPDVLRLRRTVCTHLGVSTDDSKP